jgi:dihydrofolate reductase
MRKLIESTLVSLDGVIEAPERWAIFDAEDTALSLEQLGNYDAFVMGRVTYQKFYANWGHITGNPYIDLISAMPKYVASRSLTQTAWNATLLGPDPSSAIARLKDQPGKDLIKYGHQPLRRHARARPPDRRVPLLDHSRRGWPRAAAVRGRGHLQPRPQAHRPEEAGKRIGNPDLCSELTSVLYLRARTICGRAER